MRKIVLTKSKYTIVDDDEYLVLNKYKWYSSERSNKFYAARMDKRMIIYMHRIITCCPAGLEVDHIDGDSLNNQKSNLRICNRLENIRNSNLYKNNTTGYKGVRIRHKNKFRKFAARIVHNKKDIHLGSYYTLKEAAFAYNVGAKKYYGEFAKLNII